jgi:hypothetical protein
MIQFCSLAFELVRDGEKEAILVVPTLSGDASQPPIEAGFLSELDPLRHWRSTHCVT